MNDSQDWLRVMGELRKRKLSPLKRYCGQRQDPECVARWHAEMKEWNREYRQANKMFKATRAVEDAEWARRDSPDGPKLSLVRSEVPSTMANVPKVVWWAAGGIAVGGLVYLLTRKKRVAGREFTQGVHPALLGLLDLWDREGWFNVSVAPPMILPSGRPLDGGLRTDPVAQAEAAKAGLSKATTLESTPHGRGAALDIYPEGFDQYRDFASQPEMAGLMAQFASWAAQQTVNGFRFYPGINFGDYPHIEIENWRSLPFLEPQQLRA